MLYLNTLKRRVNRAIEVLPIVLPVFLGVFGLGAVTFLLFGALKSYLVFPICGLLGALGSVTVIKYYPRAKISRARALCNILVLLGVLAWGGFNAQYTTQHVFGDGDAGDYTNSAIWLKDHDSLDLKVPSTFGNVRGVRGDAIGLNTVKGATAPGTKLYSWGQSFLPVLTALAGRLVGLKAMFDVNVAFGMVALLAVYGLGRMLVRPEWAMVAVGAIGVSMPMLAFSRDMYSEPLAMALIFGLLSVLLLSIKQAKSGLWFIAGLMAGISTLVRIDALLTVAGVLLFVILMLAITADEKHPGRPSHVWALMAGVLIASAVGWLDLFTLGKDYYLDHLAYLVPEALLIAGLVALGSLLIWLCSNTDWLRLVDVKTKRWRAEAVGATVVIILLALLSRPLWTTGHSAKYPLGRSYLELTTYLVSWYLGSVLALLAAVGLIQMLMRVMSRKDLATTAYLCITVVSGGLYLCNALINPVQIYGSRRFLPVILPAAALCGVFAAQWLYDKNIARLRFRYVYMTLSALVLVVTPLAVSRPIIHVRGVTELAAMDTICSQLPPQAAVLWLAPARKEMILPTRTICHVPSAAYGPIVTGSLPSSAVRPSKATLSQIATNAQRHGRIAVVGTFSPQASYLPLPDSLRLTTVVSYHYRVLKPTYGSIPRTTSIVGQTIKMGIIKTDGSIQGLPSGR